MDLHLTGKRILITGGSKGIGRASAMALAAEGCDIVLVARDPAVLAQTAEAVRSRHQVRVETIPADLSLSSDIEPGRRGGRRDRRAGEQCRVDPAGYAAAGG